MNYIQDNIFYHFFSIDGFFTVCLAILTLLAVLLMIVICFILFLDMTYRPNTPQYPFNVILDRIIPLIAIFSPTILVFTFKLHNNIYLPKFLCIIILHAFVLIPILNYWSKHRNWINNKKKILFTTVDNPKLLLAISIALLFPSIWGVYFSMARFLRMGTHINFFSMLSFVKLEYLGLGIKLIPYCYIGFPIMLRIITYMRPYLWYQFLSIIRVIHLYLLRFTFYLFFWIMLYKITFMLFTFISLNNMVYPKKRKYSNYRYVLYYFYCSPKWLLLFPFLCGITEIICNHGQIYYSFYAFFFIPIIYSILYFLYEVYTSEWITDLCYAELYARKWNKPTYLDIFWINMFDSENSQNIVDILSNMTEKENIDFYKAQKRYLDHRSNIRSGSFILYTRVQHLGYSIRIRAAYKTLSGVRWVHTEAPKVLHSATGYIARTFFQRVALIQENWNHHYAVIQRAEKYPSMSTINVPTSCYKDFIYFIPKNMTEAIEFNLCTNFLPLVKAGVSVEPYNHRKHFNNLITQPQPEPDLVVDFSNSGFAEKGIHGMDQKSGKSKFASNIIYSKMEEKVYAEKMRRFIADLTYNYPNYEHLNEIMKTCQKLKTACNDITTQQLDWARGFHYFPKTHIFGK